MQQEIIAFIGGGNMAEALVRGIIAAGTEPQQIMVAEPLEQRRRYLHATYAVTTVADAAAVVTAARTVILAVKPQVLHAALEPLAALFTADKLLISILAGVTTAALEAIVSPEVAVVRVMPNTPALVGCGAAAMCAGSAASGDDMKRAAALLAAVGEVVTVNEAQMDAVTGLSGSGPAYVYTVIEALADGGVLEGLPRDVALKLAAQTVLGAAQMVVESGEHPALLRDKVCSPGGTTIAAMQRLEDGGVRAALLGAVQRAAARSRELG